MATAPLSRRLQCDHGLRRQAIVESLLREVFQGLLRAGQHLATQQLAERFGVSHTPVREALIALAGIGVIDLVPNRGAIVRRVSAKDVREIFQVRRALECEAVRLACGSIDCRQLESLAAELRRLKTSKQRLQMRTVEKARVTDSRLHDLIAASCGNAFLANELARLTILFRAFRDLAWEHDTSRNDFRRLTEEFDEHLAIIEALMAGDRRRASQAMSHHIRSGGKYWSRVLPDAPPAALHVKSSRKTRSRITPSRITPSRITPSRITPSRITPSRITPSRITPSRISVEE